LKYVCLFQEDWFNWIGKCSILQKIYFDLGVPVSVSIPRYSMFLFGFSLYQNARLLQVFVTCTLWGVCNLYKREMKWMKVKKHI
jgi:hypothetical protein